MRILQLRGAPNPSLTEQSPRGDPRGPEVRRPGLGLRPAWSPRGCNGKRRAEAAAAFQLGGWRRPGRAPGGVRPPQLRPRPRSRSTAGTLQRPCKHLSLPPAHDHRASILRSARSFNSRLSNFPSLHATPPPAAHSTPAPGPAGPSRRTRLPPPQRPPVASRAHSFCSLQREA